MSFQQLKCLIIFILNQLNHPDIELKSYISTLPKEFPEHSFFWPKEDLEKLKNTFFMNSLKKRLEEVNEIKRMIEKTYLKSEKISLNDIKRAYIMVMSRDYIIRVDDEPFAVLNPISDLFNFSPISNTSWEMNLNDENDNFLIKSKQLIKKGEEIFVDYGMEDNPELLLNYGFTLKKNPFPLKTYIFRCNYQRQIFELTLNENVSNVLIQSAMKLLNNKNKDLKINQDKNKEIDRHLDVYKTLMKCLSEYKNKKLISEIKRSFNASPNNKNIFRVLVSEDKLIKTTENMIDNIVEILQKAQNGIDNLKNYKSKRCMIQNLTKSQKIILRVNYNYFMKFLS